MQANVKLIFSILFLISLHGTAQNKGNDSLPVAIKLPDAGIIFNWQTNATSFTNAFLYELNNGVISQQSKENSQKKLNKKNYFVHQMEGGLYYVLPLKSSRNTGLIIEAGAGLDMDGSFSKDAYELILNGNAHYKNQTKAIGKLSFRSLSYQKVGVGLRKYFNNKSQCINATIDFISGDQCNLLKVSRGSVYTEENGEYVDVDLAFDWHYTSSGSALLKPKGYGAALNLNWIKQFSKHNSRLSIDIKNVGLVHFNKSSEYRSMDTSIHYTGFDFGTLNAKSLLHDFNLKDSVTDKFHVNSTQGSFNYYLSGLLEIKYERSLNAKSYLSVQGNLFFFNALPMLKVSYLYNLNGNWNIGASVRAGGYSKLDFDILARYKISKLYLDATIRSVEGLIIPKQFSGLGAYLHLGIFL